MGRILTRRGLGSSARLHDGCAAAGVAAAIPPPVRGRVAREARRVGCACSQFSPTRPRSAIASASATLPEKRGRETCGVLVTLNSARCNII